MASSAEARDDRRRGALDGVIIVLALLGASARAFVLDDAFISFRYAENFANGHGLVFNIGERVEGYTNFLWVMLLSPFARWNVDLVPVAKAAGLLLFGGSLLVVRRLATGWRQAEPDATERWRWLPSLTLVGCACNASFLDFATGGLETSLFTFLGVLGVWQVDRAWKRPSPLSPTIVGLIGVALTLTRPDGALLFAVLGVSVLLATRRAQGWLRPLAQLTGVLLVLWVPYFSWRWSFYGYPFPNTFYAKNAGGWQLERGIPYLGTFAASYPYVLLVIPVVIIASVPRLRRRLLPKLGAGTPLPILWTLAAAISLFSMHVAKAGGDFMEYRFMAPLVPLFLLILELAVWSLSRPAAGVGGLCASFALLLFFHRPVLLPEPLMEPVEGLAHHLEVQRWDEQGRVLGRLLPPDTLIATTAAGAIPYYSKLRTIDLLGLTDAFVAHLPMPCTSRVTIGHCKHAPESYLRDRKVNLVVRPMTRPISFSRSEPRRPDEVLIRAWGDAAFRARYVTRTPELDALLSSNEDVKVGRPRRSVGELRRESPPTRQAGG